MPGTLSIPDSQIQKLNQMEKWLQLSFFNHVYVRNVDRAFGSILTRYVTS